MFTNCKYIQAYLYSNAFNVRNAKNIKFINNRCRYQSITRQYLKRCLIKNYNNYVFRPIAAIIRFSFESMVVVLYTIGMATSRRSQHL